MSKRRLRIDVAFDSATEALFVLDAKRRVVFFNRGCVELCGCPSEDVLGLPCLFSSDAGSTPLGAVTSALAPPDEVFAEEVLSVPKYFANRQTGQSQAKLVNFHRIRNDEGDTFILGLIIDVPKAKPPIEESLLTQVHAELGALRHALRQRYRLSSIVAKSASMLRVLEQINAARQSMMSIALIGEAGAGKEHVARAIHYESEHGAKAFVPIDCLHLPPDEVRSSIERLLESDWNEITPVSALHPGCLYLQHVEALPRELQQRLLDFLEADSGRAFRQHVRLIVSSEQDLAEAVAADRMIESFYYQVTCMPIAVPPLRTRLEELRLFAQHFIEESNRTGGKQITGIAADVWSQLEEYSWPGNLDELRDVIFAAHSNCKGSVIAANDLPLRFRSGLDAQSLSPATPSLFEPLASLLQRVERQHVEAALQQAKGNKTNAAKLLGLSRVALNSRLEAFGLSGEGADSES